MPCRAFAGWNCAEHAQHYRLSSEAWLRQSPGLLTFSRRLRQHRGALLAIKTSAESSVGQHRQSHADVQRRVDKAVGLINTADLLAPFDRSAYTASLVIWQAIAEIAPENRSQLLDRLNSRDIKRLWRLAGQRYHASQQQLQLSVGSYDIWDDLPPDLDQVVEFEGKAAVPLSGLFKFRKAFFLHPKTDELCGRVDLQKGPLGNALYPLYYKASVTPSLIPATDELTDMQLQYQSDDLSMEHIPKGWPQPREPLFPFNGGLTDYCRLVAPGVLVGVGWKAARPGRDVGRRFLHFMLVRRYP